LGVVDLGSIAFGAWVNPCGLKGLFVHRFVGLVGSWGQHVAGPFPDKDPPGESHNSGSLQRRQTASIHYTAESVIVADATAKQRNESRTIPQET
jgi:hypothetical protein